VTALLLLLLLLSVSAALLWQRALLDGEQCSANITPIVKSLSIFSFFGQSYKIYQSLIFQSRLYKFSNT
jgi:hypothetical protein